MDIFVIHSGGDRDEVMEKLRALKKEKKNLNFLLLESGSNPKKDETQEPQQDEVQEDELAPRHPLVQKIIMKLWWLESARKIQRSQLVVFYVGKNSHTSPYIGWEIKTAIRYKKPIYTIKLDDSFEDKHPALMVKDRFSRRISRGDTVLENDAQLLDVMKQNGGEVVLGSDSHHRDNLTFYFDECVEILKENRIDHISIFNGIGFDRMAI
jgi:hypothetical protein